MILVIWRLNDKFIGWPIYAHTMWANEIYIFNIVPLPLIIVHTVLPSVLQCLDHIDKKIHEHQIWRHKMNFSAHFGKIHFAPKFFQPQLEPFSGEQTLKWQTQWRDVCIYIKSRMNNKREGNLRNKKWQ